MSYADLIGPYAVVITNGVKQGNGGASEVWSILDLDSGGISTFSVALALKTDPLTITHWATYTFLEAEVYTNLKTMTTTQMKDWLIARAAAMGRPFSGSVNPALPNSIEISTQGENFWQFIDTLGLQVYAYPDSI